MKKQVVLFAIEIDFDGLFMLISTLDFHIRECAGLVSVVFEPNSKFKNAVVNVVEGPAIVALMLRLAVELVEPQNGYNFGSLFGPVVENKEQRNRPRQSADDAANGCL
ncbi:MAG: hypothetical protein ACXVC0_18205 [Bdellovibrionota bacterium]